MPASMKHLTDKTLNLSSLLARWKDGLYYTASIIKCEKSRGRCLICFEDGSEVWVHKKDLHIQLTADQIGEPDDIVCCVCDDPHEDDSDEPNMIVLCDICNQAYHQKCHRPHIDDSVLENPDDHDWICATCSYILNQSNPSKLVTGLQQQQQQQKQPQQQLKQPIEKPKHPIEKPKHPIEKPKQPEQQQQTREPADSKTSAPPVINSQKQAPKVKETQTKSAETKVVAPPIAKVTTAQTAQKPAPYYPLSGQARAATSSTAALASLTASSASIVGSPAGRTKQDLVNQSNRSSQRQQQQQPQHPRQPGNVEVISSPPVKHAVRKSSINFVMPPERQSALPTATRSVPSSVGPPAKVPRLVANTSPTSITPIAAVNLTPIVTGSLIQSKQSPQQPTISSNNSSNSLRNQDYSAATIVPGTIPRQPVISCQSNIVNKQTVNQQTSSTEISPVVASAIAARAGNTNSNPATTYNLPPYTIVSRKITNNRAVILVEGRSAPNSSSHSSASQSIQSSLVNEGSSGATHPTVIVSVDSQRKDNST